MLSMMHGPQAFDRNGENNATSSSNRKLSQALCVHIYSFSDCVTKSFCCCISFWSLVFSLLNLSSSSVDPFMAPETTQNGRIVWPKMDGSCGLITYTLCILLLFTRFPRCVQQNQSLNFLRHDFVFYHFVVVVFVELLDSLLY